MYVLSIFNVLKVTKKGIMGMSRLLLSNFFFNLILIIFLLNEMKIKNIKIKLTFESKIWSTFY